MIEPLIINNFNEGVADSPHQGHALMRNLNIFEYPGAMKAEKINSTFFQTAISQIFSANDSTDIIQTIESVVPITGTAVTVSSTGSLPSPLSAGTVYFIIKISDNTAKLATTWANADAGTAINLTNSGSGVHTIVTVNPGVINHIIRDTRSNSVYYFQDSNARIWVTYVGVAHLVTGNTLTGGQGNGIVLFTNSNSTKVYLFAFRDAAVDVVEVTATANFMAPSWTNSWQALNSAVGSANSHNPIVGQDNIIYFPDGRYVGSIRENAGSVFAPADAGTYTYNNQALDLPQGEVAYWIEELGINLLISGNSYNKIYPWDRISDSFNLPLIIPEDNIYRLKNIGNIVYIQAGKNGNIYYTQGSYVKHFKHIPDYITNNSIYAYSNITWGGLGVKNGSLLCGISSQLNSACNGIYLIESNGIITQDNIAPGTVLPLSLLTDTELYFIGYDGGCSKVGSTRYTSYESIFQSALYRVATKTEKATYSTLEVVTAKPAATGHIRVKYRQDTSSSFSSAIATFTADSSTVVFEQDIGLIDLENIQIQVEFDGAVEIVEIRLLP